MLIQLYTEHTDKVSDKWSLYLNEYERLFTDYCNNPIHLLEIGVQNGGSLEIYAKYFSNASVLIGCDINPNCANLDYNDSRIHVIVGDANAPEVCAQVLELSKRFDIIIDDGSHQSNDIIKSFALYFPYLVDGGLFIVEDLHCSYWNIFKGGLFDPYSSLSFFKRLADVISYEHWGVSKTRVDILRGFFTRYDCSIDEDTLSQVHSVEFINSMCVVRKASSADNSLGLRVIAGNLELVVPGHLELNDQPYQFDQNLDQSNNHWSVCPIPPDEAFQNTELALANSYLEISSLNQSIAEREEQITNFTQALVDSDNQISSLNQIVKAYQNSTSWWLTKPIRFVGRKVKQCRHLQNLISRFNSFFLGETEVYRKNKPNHLHIYCDNPKGLFKIIKDSFVISGWGVDINACTAAKIRIRIGKDIYYPHRVQREDVQRCFTKVCNLPIDVGFTIVPSVLWGLHFMWIDVESTDNTWIPFQRALLFRVPQIILMMLRQRRQVTSYKDWARIEQKELKAELSEITRHIDVMLHKPIFTVVIDMRQNIDGWEKSLLSIRKQIYPHYELRALVNVGTKLPFILEQAAKPLHDSSLTDVLGDFIVFIESTQSLSSNAFYEFANAVNQYPDLDLIYGDEDRISSSGERCDPFYKPDWSPDYLETFNYIGFPSCFRTKIARTTFYNAGLYDLVLRFTECTTKIWHVAKILGHGAERQVDDEALAITTTQNISALQGRLNRTERYGSVREHELYRGCYDIQLDLKREPLISIIIPTAGKTVTVGERQIDLITNVIDQIRNLSTYKNIEIIVVDNDDLSERQRNVLTDQGCKLITYAEPIFNISKKLNLGASIATGEFFLLMNDDIEILTPSWIERMIEHFEKPHVGVVGGKLLYPNRQIQHVGVVHNHGNPDHVRRLFPGEEAGYYFSTCGVRNYMGVTGAVMMTLSTIYQEVGGYSEELAVSFNDIDYCLKVQKNGYFIVYAPKVELVHMESLSRVPTMDMFEYYWYQKRWAHQLVSDPYYNELFLKLAPPTFVPCVNQRLL